jgi:hypothetical protein
VSPAKKNRRLVADPSGNVVSIRPEVKLKAGWSLWQTAAKVTPVAPAPKPAPAPPSPKAKD